MLKKYRQIIWEFIRGDLATDEFEKWLYKAKELEELVGGEFYLEIVSTDYQSKSQIYELKQNLREKLHLSDDLRCQCITLANTAITDMGSDRDKAVFATFKTIRNFGEPLWWLSLYNCTICRQFWLVAHEENQNDINCLKRLTNDEGTQIAESNKWPKHFRTYEELLIIGRDNGCSVTFVDPLNDSSLIYTAINLAKERPGISVAAIASLLSLDHELAVEVCKRAVSEEKVNISFPE